MEGYENPTAMDFVREARNLVGVPYQHMGRNPKVGLDCVGLLLATGRATGCNERGFRDLPYGRYPAGWQMVDEFGKFLDVVWDQRKNTEPLQPFLENGDVLIVAFRKLPMHIGIVSIKKGGWNIIHAYSVTKKVVEHGLDGSWLSMGRALLRVREFSDG